MLSRGRMPCDYPRFELTLQIQLRRNETKPPRFITLAPLRGERAGGEGNGRQCWLSGAIACFVSGVRIDIP